MTRPPVADGRDGRQIWRVAENVLNKQSVTPNTGQSSSSGGRRGANVTSPQKQRVTRSYTES
jgi:hypothetical protein